MFKKFFGKKNDGFYMQVDESAPPKAAVAPPEVVAKAEVEVESVSTAVTPTAVAVVETPVEQKNDKKAKSAKTSIKKDKKQEQEKKEVAQAAAAPVVPAFTNFATDYLVTPAVAGNRRRPGANMKGFMSMARDVKEMKKGSQGNQQKAAKKVEA